MKKNSINLILEEVLKKIKPQEKELKSIENYLKDFLKKIENKLKTMQIDADIFVGGSFAKNTLVRKEPYDVDIFIRFSQKYKEDELSKLTAKLLENVKKVSLIHGSRDYFQIRITPNLFFEMIPVSKIKIPKEAENTTDLSYLHVKYINKKIKNKKILDEILLAKAFCYATHCYGAESYVKGFSGYGIELLIYYYGSFLKFIKSILKQDFKKSKIIIDIEKHYKIKKTILMDLNSSKLISPIILIDPTYKQRNVLAALSQETLERFKKECEVFLNFPDIKLFEIKKTDLEQIKTEAEKKNYEFILIEIKTDKQEGDIAGSKLLKFHKHFNKELEKFFDVKKKGFNYNGKKSARYFFVGKVKKEILFPGPKINDEKNISKFKKKHPTYFTKKGKLYAKENLSKSLGEFVNEWKTEYKRRLKEMYIKEFKIIS